MTFFGTAIDANPPPDEDNQTHHETASKAESLKKATEKRKCAMLTDNEDASDDEVSRVSAPSGESLMISIDTVQYQT